MYFSPLKIVRLACRPVLVSTYFLFLFVQLYCIRVSLYGSVIPTHVTYSVSLSKDIQPAFAKIDNKKGNHFRLNKRFHSESIPPVPSFITKPVKYIAPPSFCQTASCLIESSLLTPSLRGPPSLA